MLNWFVTFFAQCKLCAKNGIIVQTFAQKWSKCHLI